jgi:uncharacterized ferredoxin-like protein
MIEMNTPKVVGCLLCGFRTENVLEIKTFQEFGCPNCNNKMKSKGLTPERLERIKQIITEQKEKDANNG